MIETYLKERAKRVFLGVILFVALVVLCFISVFTGSFDATFLEQLNTLFTPKDGSLSYIVHNIRLPKTLSAIICGAALAVSGVVMQTILKNPLASPFTLGVSQGAAFGATAAIIFFGAGAMSLAGNTPVRFDMPYLIAVFAFLGGLLSSLLILLLSAFKRVSSEGLILSGVAISAFFTASIMLMQYFASDVAVSATVFWTFGDLSKASWREVYIMGVLFVPFFCYVLFCTRSFNALLWGEDSAKSRGVNVVFFRIKMMLIASMLTSVVTAFLGIIGFIGLLAPHFVRLLVGSDHNFLIFYSALFGACLLLLADIIARSVLAPTILPVGIITSFIGAPLFLALLLRKKT